MPRTEYANLAELPRRFMAKVELSAGSACWLWTAYRNADGYGRFALPRSGGQQRVVMAHRYAYEALVGPIPEGQFLDHLCRERACVNPDHLEPVESRENTLRGVEHGTYGRANRRKTQCPHGHPYAGANLRLDRHGRRYCRACDASASERRRRARA